MASAALILIVNHFLIAQEICRLRGRFNRQRPAVLGKRKLPCRSEHSPLWIMSDNLDRYLVLFQGCLDFSFNLHIRLALNRFFMFLSVKRIGLGIRHIHAVDSEGILNTHLACGLGNDQGNVVRYPR